MTAKLKNALIAGGLVIVLAIVSVSVLPSTAGAEGENQRLISVTGEAKIEVKPDMVTASFGVETTASDAQTAQRDNSTRMTAIITALTTSGISKDDIQTSNFSLYPVYEWTGERSDKQVLTGYRCNNTVTVEVKDLTKIGGVIDSAVTAGATNVNGLTFGLQNPDAYRESLLTSAVSDAKLKADIIAKAAGYTITGVQTISDPYTSYTPAPQNIAYKAMGDSAAVPIESGSLTLSASVRIDYTF